MDPRFLAGMTDNAEGGSERLPLNGAKYFYTCRYIFLHRAVIRFRKTAWQPFTPGYETPLAGVKVSIIHPVGTGQQYSPIFFCIKIHLCKNPIDFPWRFRTIHAAGVRQTVNQKVWFLIGPIILSYQWQPQWNLKQVLPPSHVPDFVTSILS